MNKSYFYKDYKIEILYEDKYIAILNKPTGLLTHKKNEFDLNPSLQESLKDQFTISDDEQLQKILLQKINLRKCLKIEI